jgi:hypothetical protein
MNEAVTCTNEKNCWVNAMCHAIFVPLFVMPITVFVSSLYSFSGITSEAKFQLSVVTVEIYFHIVGYR